MKQIEEIRRLMFEHQENNGFDTVFDHIDDLLNEIEEGVSKIYSPAEPLREQPKKGEYVFSAWGFGFCMVNWEEEEYNLEKLNQGCVFEYTEQGALGVFLKFQELKYETKSWKKANN
jgi:hypothetical protein